MRVYELPGPRSRALVAREAAHLAPGVQQIATLAGIAIDRGEGATLRDADGNVYLDFFAGVGVASIGHGHPALAQAVAEQAARLSAGSFTTEARVRFLERVAAIAPGALHRTMLYSGGAEAVESALRLARARTGREAVVSFEGGFHGKTAGVAALAPKAPYPDGDGAAACLDALEALVARTRPAAVLVEPMQGTAGNVIPPPEFLPGAAAIARRHGALLIADEMITGFGRTGRLFGVEHTAVEPDLLLFGKGVAGGQPVSGLVATDAVLDGAEPWTRPSASSSSFGGGPLACAAADAVTRVIVEEDLSGRAARTGAVLLAALREVAARRPSVRAVRGVGLLLGLDLALDRPHCERFFRACLRRGLLAMAYQPRVRLNPPLVLSEAQAREGAAILDEALAAVERGAE